MGKKQRNKMREKRAREGEQPETALGPADKRARRLDAEEEEEGEGEGEEKGKGKEAGDRPSENEAAQGEGGEWAGLSRTQKRNKLKKHKLASKLADKKAKAGQKTIAAADEPKETSRVPTAADARIRVEEEEREEEEGEGAHEEEVVYPYVVDTADHCETPTDAYADIRPMLDAVATKYNKTRATLRIYDPYFCEGSMRARMASLGFTNVINEKRDFYADVEGTGAGEGVGCPQVPDFDVLVTNPPYSGDHVPKLLAFAACCGRPFFLLMPNYFYMKEYVSLPLRVCMCVCMCVCACVSPSPYFSL
jgi:hypothetical protein